MVATYVSILRRRLLLMVVVALLVGALAFTVLNQTGEVYRSEAIVRVGTQNISDVVLGRVGSYADPDRRVANELQVLSSPTVLVAAAERTAEAGTVIQPEGIAQRITLEQRAFSDAISVIGEAADPALAQLVVDSLVDAYLEHRRSYQRADLEGIREDLLDRLEVVQGEIAALDQQIATLPEGSPEATTAATARAAAVVRYQEVADSLETVSVPLAGELSAVEVVSPAFLPGEPVPTSNVRAAILATLAGLIVAGAVALLLEVLRNPVRTRDEAELVAAAPVLATVPRPRGDVARWISDLQSTSGPAPSASRALRFSIEAVAGSGSFPRSLMVAGAAGDEADVLFVAMAVAASCGGSGMRALLVADLGGPLDDLRTGGERRTGVVAGLEAAEATALAGVHWLPATSTPDHVGVLLGAPSLNQTVQALEEAYDVVVVVPPPSSETAEAVAIARTVRAVVVVCAVGKTVGKRLQTLVGVLQRGGALVTGLALTTRSKGRPSRSQPAPPQKPSRVRAPARR